MRVINAGPAQRLPLVDLKPVPALGEPEPMQMWLVTAPLA
jgi:hypothetical protein